MVIFKGSGVPEKAEQFIHQLCDSNSELISIARKNCRTLPNDFTGISGGGDSIRSLWGYHGHRICIGGIVLCSGGNGSELLGETIAMIEQTKHKLGGLPILVAHCDELTASSKRIFESALGVKTMNICKQGVQDRLRGFFCKPAALIQSPFNHTILVDSDVIFFKRPALLLQSTSYLKTGALFFRDRLTVSRNQLTLTKGTSQQDTVLAYVKELAVFAESLPEELTFRFHRHRTRENASLISQPSRRASYFLSKSGKALDHMQESSIVLIHKPSHQATITVLQHMLSSFKLGYGDKEMYWLAALAARDRFSFEPYLVGSLGDCGAAVHFDPREVLKPGKSAEPFYVNAEYLIDPKKLRAEGDFLGQGKGRGHTSSQLTRPILANHSSAGVDDSYILKSWKNLPHGFYLCGACAQSGGCVNAAQDVVEEIRIRQRMTLDLMKDPTALHTPEDYDKYHRKFAQYFRSRHG